MAKIKVHYYFTSGQEIPGEKNIFRSSEELKNVFDTSFTVGGEMPRGETPDDAQRAGAAGLVTAGRLYSKFKKIAPQILHIHCRSYAGRNAVLMPASAARLAGIKNVVFSFSEFEQKEGMQIPFGERLGIGLVKNIVASSPFSAGEFAGALPSKKGSIETILSDLPSLPDVKRKETIREELGVPPQKLLLFCSGPFEEYKGHMVILEAMRILSHKYSIYKMPYLVLCGTGPLEDRLRAYSRDTGTLERVIFRPPQEENNLLNASDAVIIPSLYDEYFPAAAIKAMAMGKGVLASRTGAVPDYIVPLKNGLLVRPKSIEDMRRAVEVLVDDIELCKFMGYEAQNRYRDNFSESVAAARYSGLYNTLAAAK